MHLGRHTIEDLASGLDQDRCWQRPILERRVAGRVILIGSFLDLGTLGIKPMGSVLLPDKTTVFSDPHLATAVGLR
jgi:hypothetical protein